jgi:hypothetical protein
VGYGLSNGATAQDFLVGAHCFPLTIMINWKWVIAFFRSLGAGDRLLKQGKQS